MKKRNDYSRRHEAQRLTTPADRAEFLALKEGSTVVDSGVYDERVAGALDDFDPNAHDAESWQQLEDLKQETAVSRTHEELERRVKILGEAYPFRIEKGTLFHHSRHRVPRIRHSSDAPGIYEFLLSICNSTTLASGKHVCLPRLFERIAAKLVAVYFGEHAECIHTGSPRDQEIGRSFKDAMETVSKRTGEWVWGPEEGLPGERHQGDEGCDFVVWLSAPDRRQIGQLFVLGQCACGNNWQTKYGDLNLKKLHKWFNRGPLSGVDPVRSFATPHHVTDVVLRDASSGDDGGLFFDRARLTMTAFHAKKAVIGNEMKKDMENLIELVLRGD